MAARAERGQARAQTVSHLQRAATQTAVTLTPGGDLGRTVGVRPLPSPADGRGGSSWEHAFPGTEDQLTLMRATILCLLGGCPVADDVVLLMSEMAANAVRHSRSGRDGGTFTARLVDIPAEYVLGMIEDGGSGWAGDLPGSVRQASGLQILLALSSDCGTYGGRHKRTVWFLVHYPAFHCSHAAHIAGSAPYSASSSYALDLEPVVFGLMHPDPGLTVMGLAEADQIARGGGIPGAVWWARACVPAGPKPATR